MASRPRVGEAGAVAIAAGVEDAGSDMLEPNDKRNEGTNDRILVFARVPSTDYR